ncbi:MAG: efflux RND transporter permease subunit [Oceanicoccus sp.]
MQNTLSLINVFTQHRVASNLLMIIMIMMGMWGLTHINTQLNPNQRLDSIGIQIGWPGASAEDIERLITEPIEYQIRSLDDLQEYHSTSRNSHVWISLKFDSSTDMSEALDAVKQQLAQVRDLPPDMEPPIVAIREHSELVAMVLLTGKVSPSELAVLARQYEQELLELGIDKVEFQAMPEEEIAIQISSLKLLELGASLDQIAATISSASSDVPFGSIGKGQHSRELRSLDQQRDVKGFNQLPVRNIAQGDLIPLGEIADIKLQQRDNQVSATHGQKPAVLMRIIRASGTDTLEAAAILKKWHQQRQSDPNNGIETKIFLEAWLFAKDQINLIVKNGLGGLILVIIALLIFLNGRVAWWVMLGIPVSFLAALAIFYFLGGTINLISMIALVMALGIVVDDAIVVGEHSLSRFQQGNLSPGDAASSGASRMFTPVMASSLTTLAAFFPLMMVDEDSIREIPLVMLLVIIASLVECFLIMPGHLRGSFEKLAAMKNVNKKTSMSQSSFRVKFDRGFSHFRDTRFMPVLRWTLANRQAAICLALATFMVAFSLLISGRIKPELNLNINFEFLEAGFEFTEGVSPEEKSDIVSTIEQAMLDAEKSLGGNLLTSYISFEEEAFIDLEHKRGYQYGNIMVELVSPDQRTVTLKQFTAAWRSKLPPLHQVEALQIETGNKNWADLSLHFKGSDINALKSASAELQDVLTQIPGVSNVYDDLPYGNEQWVFRLTSEGRQLGLTASAIGRQIYSAYEGYRIQLFNSKGAEIEVRVKLPDSERNQLVSLRQFPIMTPGGEMVPLATIAEIETRKGIDVIQHVNGQLAVNVNAAIDKKITTAITVVNELQKDILPALVEKYDLQYGLSGSSAEESRAAEDLLLSATIALTLIYLILAWIFSSYTWPLAVMIAIPLALTGALIGLQLLDMNLGVMSIMGLFTLTGVIINDSIILVTTFKENRAQGMAIDNAIELAAKSRLRAVILTSLTTTLGLIPMLLETSPIGAQMAPLAAVICFGMLYGTLLILLVIPALLSSIEHHHEDRELARTANADTLYPRMNWLHLLHR